MFWARRRLERRLARRGHGEPARARSAHRRTWADRMRSPDRASLRGRPRGLWMKVIRKSHRGVSFGLAAAIGLAACAAAAERVNLIAAPPPVFPDLSTALTVALPESRGMAAKPGFALFPAADLFAAPTSPAIVAMTPLSGAALQPPSALEVALAAMIAEGVKSSPIGAGDWRAARQAIHDVYVGREFAPIWMAPDGRLTPAGVAALSRLERADEDGLDLSAFALPKGPLA